MTVSRDTGVPCASCLYLLFCSAERIPRQFGSGIRPYECCVQQCPASVLCPRSYTWYLGLAVPQSAGLVVVLPRGRKRCGDTVSVIYTECPRRNGPDLGRVFLMLNYTEKPQNTYIQSSMVAEI